MRHAVAILIRLIPLFVGMAPALGQLSFQYDLPGNLTARSPQVTGSPVILRHPAMQVAGLGRSASFSVLVADSSSVTYQWRFEGANISGANKDALLLTNVTAASEGNYSVVVANASGSVNSAPAMLYWDSVGDGLPDSWKIKYFGSLTNVSAGSDAPLRDGISNLEKFLDGANPTNGAGVRPRLTLAGLNGSASAAPDLGKYTAGQSVTLAATAHTGFEFVGWSGDLLGTNNPATIIMDRSKSITAVNSLPLPFTMNTTNVTWRTGGDVPWFGQNFITYDGIAAAQNGPLGNNQVSWLEATIYMSGEGTVSFWSKRITSGSTISFTINGIPQFSHSPQAEWSEAIFYLPAGTAVIRWSYEKTFDSFLGFEALWVDQLTPKVYSDPLADNDSDGLADLWEYQHFGHLRISGTTDFDSDGINNLHEYVDGTHPTIRTSALPRLVISASGGTVTLSPALERYSYLQPVTLTAAANPGFTFVGWREDLTGSTNPAMLIMDESKAVSAIFAVSAANSVVEAVDAANLPWSTGGDATLFSQTLTTHDGVDAAQTPPLGPNQQAWLQTTVNGPGPLSFWWKASASYANFRFLLNGVQQRSISGQPDWHQFSMNLPAGANTLRWAFEKATFAGGLNDAGWLDQIVFGTNVPSITTGPANRSVLQGSNVTFTVTAFSTSPLSYRWQKNGANLFDGGSVSGAATNTLTLSNVQPIDAGTYSVLVSTPAATVSSAASLAVAALVPLAEALDTSSWTWNSGGNSPWVGQNLVTHDRTDAAQAGHLPSQQESWLETTVTGPGVLSFWWKILSGAGNNRLEFVSDGVTNAILSGEIDWVPRSFLLSPGPHTLRWRYAHSFVSATTSRGAWLDQVAFVPGTSPGITAHPASQTVTGGANVTLSVSATGSGPLNYQWFFNQTNLIGSNSPTLSLANVRLANAGGYSVLVSNALGKITSATAGLVVNTPPLITSQPVGGAVLAGSNFTLSVSASGAAPLYYQWQKDGIKLPGATQASLSLGNVQPGQSGGYAVVLSNFLGSITSVVAQLTIGLPPSITIQPASRNVNAGANVTFSVTATGTPPLRYQWRQNGEEMPGRTAPDLVLTNVQFTHQALYDVVVSNDLGSDISEGAYLSVGFTSPLSIFIQPASQTVQPGASVTFSVLASGDPPLSYQWRRHGTNLPGATASSLSIVNVQAAHAGPYTVVVSNFADSITSDVAVLTVGTSGLTLSIEVSNTNVRLFWDALVGRDYQVEYKNDLLAASWSNLPPVITAAGALASAVDVLGNSQRRFYRVALLPQLNAPPSITMHPLTQTANAGANVTFSVTATGSPPLRYQWRFNGADLPQATSAILELLNVQPGQIGIYDVVVTNSVGSETSDPAFLIVF